VDSVVYGCRRQRGWMGGRGPDACRPASQCVYIMGFLIIIQSNCIGMDCSRKLHIFQHRPILAEIDSGSD